MTEQVRLHKLLARMGVASLRGSERLISEGRVSVNGRVVDTPGATATASDEIAVDGRPVGAPPRRRYILLNKPLDVLSTARDEMGRVAVTDLVPAEERLYPVGRLDRDSQGLMLLTNDGRLAERLMHPRYGVHKQYRVEVEGRITEEQMERLREGVELEDGLSKPLEARLLAASPSRSVLLITLGEGRNRQVRRTLEALGLEVLSLERLRMGQLEIGDLRPGEWRELFASEVQELRRAVGLDAEASR